MTTASSAASKGAATKAVIASAPMAAAQSEKRLMGLRRITGPLGLGDSRIWRHFRAAAELPDRCRPAHAPRYAAERALLRPSRHEFVTKSLLVQGVSRSVAPFRR